MLSVVSNLPKDKVQDKETIFLEYPNSGSEVQRGH